MTRILMLVLASDGHVYDKFQSLWRMYMNTNPSIQCYFYKGNPELDEEAKLVGDTLYIKIEDTLDNVYEKTLRAFRYFQPQFRSFDYVCRPNMSAFIDFDKYLEFCNPMPRKQFCFAVIGQHDDILFPSGSCFTMTTDLVNRLLEECPSKIEQDDVTIGKALMTWGVRIYQTNRIDYNGTWYYHHQPVPTEPIFQYRAKSDNRENDYLALLDVYNRTKRFTQLYIH